MSLLYGEGSKAFLRLQEEIIRSSDDHAIFAWPHQRRDEPGLLASSPAAFEGCRRVRAMGSRKGKSAYTMTNRGLSIALDAIPWNVDTNLVALQCVDERLYKDGKHEKPLDYYRMGMLMRRLDKDDQFVRVLDGDTTFLQQEASIWESSTSIVPNRLSRPVRKIEFNVRQSIIAGGATGLKDRVHGFRLKTPELLERDRHGKGLFKVDSAAFSAEKAILSMPHGRFGTVGFIDISAQGRKIKAIKLGFDFDYNPVCFIAEKGGLEGTTPTLDRQYNIGVNSEWQYSTEEQAEFKHIYQRTCFDTMAWSTISQGSAAQLPRHRGLWAIKGDRVHGYQCDCKRMIPSSLRLT